MMQGERIKIRAEDGSRWWGRVIRVETGMTMPQGDDGAVPRRRETTLTVVLEGPRKPAGKPAPGPCAATLPALVAGAVPITCHLQHGHEGDHTDSVARWRER